MTGRQGKKTKRHHRSLAGPLRGKEEEKRTEENGENRKNGREGASDVRSKRRREDGPGERGRSLRAFKELIPIIKRI